MSGSPPSLPGPPGRLTPLALWFAVLAGPASLAALQASLFPRWPRAAPLPRGTVASALDRAGLGARAVEIAGPAGRGHRSLEVAVSEPLAFRFAGGEELRLVRGVSRQRDNLQAATFSRPTPGLALAERRLTGPPPQASGLLRGRPALQTCLVTATGGSPGYGVTREQLLPLVDGAALGRAAWFRRLIGLQANRAYGCVLISLRSGGAAPVPGPLWRGILDVLPGALAPSPARSGPPATRR